MSRRDAEIQLLKKLYEDKLSQKDEQLNQLKTQLEHTCSERDAYKEKESLIISALTRAEELADKKIAEAQQQANRITAEAEAARVSADDYSKTIQESAQRRAESFEAEKRAEVDKRYKAIEARAVEYEVRLDKLREQLLDMSSSAIRSMEEFARSCDIFGYNLANVGDVKPQLKQLQTISADMDMPEPQEESSEEASAAKVFESINDMSQTDSAEQFEKEGKIWTVDDIIGAGKADAAETDIDALIDQVLKGENQ
jgi:DNA repair exonuclease SbcCD ATPase subunit